MKDYGGQRFEPEALLAALPHRRLLRPAILPPAKLREWRWPRMRPYNGFSHEQRVLTWQIGWLLREVGAFKLAVACDICGTTNRLGYHSEDYTDLERSPTMCSACHAVIHQRFGKPSQWREVLGRATSVKKDHWTWLLSVGSFDLAGWLTSSRNAAAVDVISKLPHWARQF